MFALASSATVACVGSTAPEFSTNVKTATSIFVFQLTAARHPPELMRDEVVGNMKILHVLKGPKPTFSSVRYSNSWCGGLRLDVGHFFVAATSRSGKVLELAAYDQSVVDISTSYYVGVDDPVSYSPLLTELKRAIKGKPLSDLVFDRRTIYYSQVTPAPP